MRLRNSVDDAEAVGLRFVFDNGQTPAAPVPRDDVGRRGPARLRRRRLARRLLRPGRAVSTTARRHGATTAARRGDRLFRNRGDGTFEDVTEPSGIAAIAWGRATAWA